ncbi:MAG: hypothetical protein ACREBG_27875 [Pyrinomonadaceae bacterium]
MKSPDTHLRLALKVVLFALAFCAPAVQAQDNPIQQLKAPPPFKIISREERVQISDTKDPKARVRITLELAETHLVRAESFTGRHDYEGSLGELGRYTALIEDGLGFLSTMSRDRNKTRDLYKRLELALRAHGPRLTAMRRSTPLEYAVWIKDLEDFTRKGRTEALNSFYGHTVFREPQQKPDDKKPNKPPKDAVPTPENKPQ